MFLSIFGGVLAMNAHIILTAVHGPLRGRAFAFHDHTLCTVGRSSDCLLALPGEGEGRLVSRWHCLLDIDPPRIGICDLGSLNGTYVNGIAVGASDRCHGAEAEEPTSQRELHSGDEVQVGSHVFRVDVLTEVPQWKDAPELCACGAGV
jgi:pSer/pThr/pTyr-binding forkhead associated (FHA) protein